MAPLINLLPNHRAESRKARARRFGVFVAVAVGVAAGLIGVAHLVIGARVSVQEDRNSYLQTEIASLDKQISQIKELKSKTQEMLARKRAVESLQASRSQAVELLNQIAQVPEGVYYTSVRQSGDDIALTGYAQSNFHVASLIRQLETSGVFTQPKLIEARQAPDPLDPEIHVVMCAINCKMTNASLLPTAPGGALPGMPAGAMVMGPNGQPVPAQGLLINGVRSQATFLGANGAPAAPIEAPPPVRAKPASAPAAAHPASLTGGVLGAPAHQALDAARMGANIAAQPPRDMQAAQEQSK